MTILQPYPAYKPSGVPWLGDVPAHWDLRRLKNWVGINEAVLPETTEPDFEFPYLEIGAVGTGRLISQPTRIRFASAPSRARRIVRTGDTIISTVRTYLKATWFAGEVNGPLICSTGFAVLTPRRSTSHKFVSYLAQSNALADRVTAESVGTVYPAIAESRLSSFHVPLPEQRAIVRYLDYVDRRIRRYVSAKRKLIALLGEEKQAIINQAVTRGLDPNVRLKPSGVDWLGDVPEHWAMRRSKRVFSPRQELARPNDIQLSATHAYGVIPQDEYERKVGRRIVKISLHLDKRRHVEVDDFVISMRSFQGGLERAWATGCIRSSYIVLRPTAEVDVEFFSYVLKSRAYIKALQSTADFIRDGQDLNFNNFCAVDLPLPPAGEQRKIAVALGEATTSINTAVARARRQIELLQEYRTRLIADVVTGKLDVREAAAQLPDEPDDQDPIEESVLQADGMDEDVYDNGNLEEYPAIERGVPV